MTLAEYKKKRNFSETIEPEGKTKKSNEALRFVIQKHSASHLHYDFRLELDGVLKSWAVPKGPSLNPKIKRLAMMVEDHPLDYRTFEGIIPEGNYGAGEVIVWDEGTYQSNETDDIKESEKKLKAGLKRGDLKFILKGQKVKGEFALVKMKKEDNSWLLLKKKDDYASTKDITEENKSVISGKTIRDLKDGSKLNSESKLEEDRQIDLSDGKKKKIPNKIKPELATLTDEAFDDRDWIFEIKWDGYRTIAEVENSKIELYSRNLKSFNEKFRAIGEALSSIKKDVILDGEVVVVDKSGRSDFQLLQNYQRTGKGNIVYYVFDILYLDGYDLRDLPLKRRKEILKEFLPAVTRIKISEHIEENGVDFFNAAAEKNLEGIIAKNSMSPYRTGKRSKEWLKIKTSLRQEAVIGGFTEPKGSRKNFGALVLGVYEGNEFVYIGHTGGGFNEADLDEVYTKLKRIERKTSPFQETPKTNTPATWVTPKLVCEVNFSEWTEDGLMRHPVFVGLREDKYAKKVVKETGSGLNQKNMQKDNSKGKDSKRKDSNRKSTSAEKSAAKSKSSEKSSSSKKSGEKKKDRELVISRKKVKVTNWDKVYFPDNKITKGDVVEYYRSVADYILPYLKDRPESLNRHPNGIKAKGFYQKDVGDMPPKWIKTESVYSESNDKKINYLVINHEAALVYTANLGAIEINPWFSRVGKLDKPDYLVIDLDPEKIEFEKVVKTALTVKEVLDEAGVQSYCKTSGATGLHIYVPLNAKYDYDVAKNFAHLIAQMVNHRIPDFTSIERSPKKRQKKVYLDFLQNRTGQTLAAPYSLRPRPGAPVATPLEWDEVKPGLNPKDFNIKTIHERLKEIGDIFKPVLGKGANLEKAIKKLEG